MDERHFPPDPHFKAIYMHHRSLKPRWVRSEKEKKYLLKTRQWTESYQFQAWPQTRYHKDFSLAVETAPDAQDFFNDRNGQVDEPARQRAIALRNKQRQRAIKVCKNEGDIERLGKDWMPYHELPAEKKRLKIEAEDNAADIALYGGADFDEFEDEEPLIVTGEKMRTKRAAI